MSLPLAINGMGRIGRALFRVAFRRPELQVVAVNDLAEPPMIARLLARDSVHGPFPGEIGVEESRLTVNGRSVTVFQEPEPGKIPWPEVGAEVVVEATGRFRRRELAAGHLRGTVRRVILSANAEDADATLCVGINTHSFDPARHTVVSNASCTTNCIAPVARVLHDAFGIRHALMNTVHAYTNNQQLLDLAHPDPRRARAAAINIIPTSTGAARAVGLVLPELAGRIDGQAVRVPTPDVSMLDLVALLERETDPEEVKGAFRQAASGELAGILAVTDEELVSTDFLGDPHSAVVDLPLVQEVGKQLFRVVAWYDNEWGYANRLADLAALVGGAR